MLVVGFGDFDGVWLVGAKPHGKRKFRGLTRENWVGTHAKISRDPAKISRNPREKSAGTNAKNQQVPTGKISRVHQKNQQVATRKISRAHAKN